MDGDPSKYLLGRPRSAAEGAKARSEFQRGDDREMITTSCAHGAVRHDIHTPLKQMINTDDGCFGRPGESEPATGLVRLGQLRRDRA